MKASDSLDELEKRTYRSTLEDGIYDIFFGVVFLILTWISVLDYLSIPSIYGYLLLIILPLIPWLGKKIITIPRMGRVEFGSKRRARKWWLLLATLAFLFMTLPLFLMMNEGGSLQTLSANAGVPIFLPLVIVPLIVGAAYFLDCTRMYLYAALLIFGVVHSDFLYDFTGKPANSLLSFGIPGVLILAYGLVVMMEFVKRYPLTVVEANHVNG